MLNSQVILLPTRDSREYLKTLLKQKSPAEVLSIIADIYLLLENRSEKHKTLRANLAMVARQALLKLTY